VLECAWGARLGLAVLGERSGPFPFTPYDRVGLLRRGQDEIVLTHWMGHSRSVLSRSAASFGVRVAASASCRPCRKWPHLSICKVDGAPQGAETVRKDHV
jgi:hypothetical protein